MDKVQETLEAATQFARESFQDDHWCGTVMSNATVTAQWIFFHQSVGREITAEHRKAYMLHFVSTQHSDGSWAIAPQSPGDVSVTIEAYCALKMLGLSPNDEMMTRARAFILSAGGMEKMRMLSRVYLAMFGLVDWSTVPQMPPEIILLPTWFPGNIYTFASWARSNIVPITLLRTREPIYKISTPSTLEPQAQTTFLDELWIEPRAKKLPMPGLSFEMFLAADFTTIFFIIVELLLKLLVALNLLPLRRKAITKCVEWIKEHQEPQGDWAGIYPPMHLGILALLNEDGDMDKSCKVMTLGLDAMDRFCAEDATYGRWMQASVSPTWDTFLMIRGLVDAGVMRNDDPMLQTAVTWAQKRQITTPGLGDWLVARPKGQAGGFAFEYFNDIYPDVDDTAAAVLSFLHQDPSAWHSKCIVTATSWVLDMQCRNGGWAAFDADNDAAYLNDMPFADMKNLCDPPTPDVTGRVLEMLGTMLQLDCKSEKQKLEFALRYRMHEAIQRGLSFLQDTKEEFGGWHGRWAVNYVFGTSTVLCGLAACGVDGNNAMARQSLRWLEAVQNQDGGWGESLESYDNIHLAGRGGESTPSQTAWALMGLLACGPANRPSVLRGVEWLVSHLEVQELRTDGNSHEARSGTWREDVYTATGFPGHFYLAYELYRHYFPMMALGRFQKAINLKQAAPFET